MADQERSGFYIVFNKIHCVLQLQKNVNNFVICNCTSLRSITETKESNLKATGEFEFHISPNKKVSIAKDHGKNYIPIRPPLVNHFNIIVYRTLGTFYAVTDDHIMHV